MNCTRNPVKTKAVHIPKSPYFDRIMNSETILYSGSRTHTATEIHNDTLLFFTIQVKGTNPRTCRIVIIPSKIAPRKMKATIIFQVERWTIHKTGKTIAKYIMPVYSGV
jgi:hypothetical protein